MRTYFAPVALLLVLVGPVSAQPPTPPAKPAALAAVPTDAFMFLTVNVGKLWDNPGTKPLRDWMATQKAGTFERVFGVAPADIDRVTIFTPVADPDVDFDPLFLVTTRKPYNEAKVLKSLGAGRERELKRKGRVIELEEGKMLHWMVLLDDHALLFTPKHALKGAAGAALASHFLAPKKDGALAQALEDAGKHDVAFGLDVHGLNVLLREEKIDKELVPYLALRKARTVTFAADFDKTARGTLKLAFADAADAKRAAPVLQEGIAALGEVIAKEITRGKDRLDPVERVLLESAITLLKAAKVETAGANVTATAEMPYLEIVAKFVAALPKSLEDSANDVRAKNNIKQLALGALNYESAMQIYPSDVYPAGAKPPAWSWRVQILPYIEQNQLYAQLDFTKAWDDPANLKRLEAMEMPKVFEIPGRPAPKGHTYCRIFSLPKNAKGTERPWLVEGQKGPTAVSITDGTSNTFMIVEAGDAVPWYKPDVLAYDGKLPLPQLGDKDSDRFLVAMGDGSVRVMRRSKLNEKTLRALITPQGGEAIDIP